MNTRRPLVGLTICYVIGTLCGLRLNAPFIFVFVCACLLFLSSLLAGRLSGSSLVRLLPLFGAVLFTGWSVTALRADELNRCAIAIRHPERGTRAAVSGVVIDDPCETPGASNTLWRFTLAAEEVQWTNGPPERARSPVSVSMRASTWSTVRYGDRRCITGVLYTASFSNAVMRRPRYFLSGYSARPSSTGHGSEFMRWCYKQRDYSARYLEIGIDDFPQHVGLLRALVLGFRQDLPANVKADFAATGVLHIVAISGSHVAVIAGIIIAVLQACGVSRVYWIVFLGPLLAVYTLGTGASSSAVRACIMGLAYFSAPMLGRRSDIYTSLSLAALIILAVDPDQLLDIGFVLSFVAVLGLVLLYPWFLRPLRRLCEPDPLRLQPEHRIVRVLRAIGQYVASLVALACACWLVSTPLTAYFFQRFSSVSLLSNILAAPLAFLILLAGCLSLALGACIEFFADIFNHANLALIEVLYKSMAFLARVPLGNVEVPQPPLWTVLLWFLALGAVLVVLTARSPRSRSDRSGAPQM